MPSKITASVAWAIWQPTAWLPESVDSCWARAVSSAHNWLTMVSSQPCVSPAASGCAVMAQLLFSPRLEGIS